MSRKLKSLSTLLALTTLVLAAPLAVAQASKSSTQGRSEAKFAVLPPLTNEGRAVERGALPTSIVLTPTAIKPANLFAAAITAAQLTAGTQTEKERRILAITPTTELQVSGRLAGKLHMVITFLETKPFYSRGVSGDQFVKRALAQMEPAPTPDWLRTYLLRVYQYHVKGVSADVVYATDDGRAFIELYNAAARTYKPGMTKEEFERQLIPGTTPGYGDPQLRKPWWVNCVRKLADWIDDHWPE